MWGLIRDFEKEGLETTFVLFCFFFCYFCFVLGFGGFGGGGVLYIWLAWQVLLTEYMTFQLNPVCPAKLL